jgi:hypothetical protein
MMVLCRFRVPALKIPPPLAAELPLSVQLVKLRTLKGYLFQIAPPSAAAELAPKVQLVKVAADRFSIAPALPAGQLHVPPKLLLKVLPVTDRFPPPLNIAPASPFDELLVKLQSLIDNGPTLLMAPPPPAELLANVQFAMDIVPDNSLLIAPPAPAELALKLHPVNTADFKFSTAPP